MSKYCVSCGNLLPDSHPHRNCSLCYGDLDYGTDGYYRAFMEDAAEAEYLRQQIESEVDDERF